MTNRYLEKEDIPKIAKGEVYRAYRATTTIAVFTLITLLASL
jgi:hypothetical protein